MTTMTTIIWDDDDKTNSEDYPWRAVTRSEALASLRPRAKTRTAAELSTHHTALHTSPNSLTTALVNTHTSLLTTTPRTSLLETIPVVTGNCKRNNCNAKDCNSLFSLNEQCNIIKTFFWNFQKCEADLCSILIDKQMLEKVFCSNIAPSLSSGNHLFYKAEYMGQSCPNQVWAITFDWSALAT